MPDLQEVDWRHEPSSDQDGFDRCLRIPGEERRETAMTEQQDERSVVDVSLRKRGRGIAIGGVEDLDRDGRIQGYAAAGARDRGRYRCPRRIGQQSLVGRVLEGDPGMDDRLHLEALEDLHQPGHVVLVGMAENEEIDASCEEGEVRAQPAEGQLGIRAAVHEHGGAAGCLDEDGVALPDVQHGHVEQPVRTRGERDRQEHAHEARRDRDRPDRTPRRAGEGAPLLRRAFTDL